MSIRCQLWVGRCLATAGLLMAMVSTSFIGTTGQAWASAGAYVDGKLPCPQVPAAVCAGACVNVKKDIFGNVTSANCPATSPASQATRIPGDYKSPMKAQNGKDATTYAGSQIQCATVAPCQCDLKAAGVPCVAGIAQPVNVQEVVPAGNNVNGPEG